MKGYLELAASMGVIAVNLRFRHFIDKLFHAQSSPPAAISIGVAKLSIAAGRLKIANDSINARAIVSRNTGQYSFRGG